MPIFLKIVGGTGAGVGCIFFLSALVLGGAGDAVILQSLNATMTGAAVFGIGCLLDKD